MTVPTAATMAARHSGGMVVGDRPSIEFMERVLSGLRRL
jgi:hypothetical protein